MQGNTIMKNNLVRYIILIIGLFVFVVNDASAIKVERAYLYRQPDGSTLRLISVGDEFFHYTMTVDGNIVAQKSDGYYYYACIGENGLEISNIPATFKEIGTTFKVSQQIVGNNHSSTSSLREKRLPKVTIANTPRQGYNVLIIPVQFNDVKFTIDSPSAYLNRMANETGFSDNGATGSLRDYFNDNIQGYDFIFTVCDVVTLDKERAYYGRNSYLSRDQNINELVSEACNKASQNGLVFSQFDNDNDGKVDQVCFVYAGHNEAEGGGENTIWPIMDRLYNKAIRLNGVIIDSYLCVSELKGSNMSSQPAGIGAFCHEFGHALGLPDLSDINGYTDGRSQSFQEVSSLMDNGWKNNDGHTPPYLNAIEREHLGIANIRSISAGETVVLEPINVNSTIIKINSTTNIDEFFLIECRKKEGWDRYIDGEGVAIYHVDKSSSSVIDITAKERWVVNLVNTVAAHQCAYMASPIGTIGEYTSQTTPAFIDWSGRGLELGIKQIAFDGDQLTFEVIGDSGERMPKITSHRMYIYQTDAHIYWTPDVLFDATWSMEWNERKVFNIEKKSDYTTCNSYVLKDLDPDEEYKCHIYFGSADNIVKDTLKLEFRTLAISSPYPRIDGVSNTHPRFKEMKLKVLNLNEDIRQIKWKIDGKTLFDDIYIPETAGEITISAEIIYLNDRSTEIITKRVMIY